MRGGRSDRIVLNCRTFALNLGTRAIIKPEATSPVVVIPTFAGMTNIFRDGAFGGRDDDLKGRHLPSKVSNPVLSPQTPACSKLDTIPEGDFLRGVTEGHCATEE